VTWTAPQVDRTEPRYVADERTSVQEFLDYHRQTLLWKCSGLTAEQLAARPIAGSSLSLLGLVRHLAYVQRVWLRIRAAGQADLDDLYCTQQLPDADFDRATAAGAEADFAVFASECALADAAVARRSLDDTFVHPRLKVTIDLRWVYTHLIEEFARHNGHADLIREQIDGATGE
jgi:Protein of unknown function (DUF664)